MKTNSNTSKAAPVGVKMQRDGKLESAWQAGLAAKPAETTIPDTGTVYDCLVVGAGITGITTALLLQTAKKKVLLVDAASPGFGTTGGTSAHINTFADTSYNEAESAFGEEGAQLLANAINDGFALIRDNVKKYHIDCDYEIKPGYLFAENEEQVKQLDEMHNSTLRVGVPVSYTTEVPVPVKYLKALMFDGQAQFHPLKYLQGLQAEFKKAGGILLENTMIDDLSTKDGIHTAKAGELSIAARNIVYATHMPPKITTFNFRCAAYRSYVIAVKLKGKKYPDALVYDMQEPYHYIRTHVIDGQQLLLVGGNDHKTGHDDPGKAFADLEKYVSMHYPGSTIKYRWSSQYYIPADGFPYIGQMPGASSGVYCATGYNGNGMMLGSIAAKILSDLVSAKANPYADVFSPDRIKPIAGFASFVKENADVVYHFIADRLSVHEMDSLKRIPKDSGKVVEFEGKKVAAYRDPEGNIHALNPVCTHAGCLVNWNGEEKSWDCPCHGTRFNIHGKVLTGPADKGLQKLEFEK